MIRYPQKISNANRGMDFEKLLNDTNLFYKLNDVALIYKKATPIRVISFKDGYILKAVYDKKSTSDYSGVFNSMPIDFEAKETKGVSFKFANMRNHQIEHLMLAKKHGSISFVLVYFSDYDRCFLIDICKLNDFMNVKKSVKMDELNCEVLVTDIVDYIKVVGEL